MESGIQSRHDQSTSRLIRTKPRAEIITTACSTAISLVIDRLLGQLAEAAAAEDGLGDQRPGNQFAEQQPGNIQRRQQGIPHHMAPEDARFAHALGAGDRDEGLNRHLIHAAHQDLRQWGGNGQCDGDNR